MKVGRILYDGLEKGYQISIAETRKVTDLLEKSKKFEAFIIYLRKEYKIPDDGYPLPEDPKDYPKYAMEAVLSDDLMDKFFEESIAINNELELPYFWWSSIAHFAFYNVFFTPERVVLEVNPDQRFSYRDRCHIVITERVSKTELHNLIDQEWGSIEEGLKLLHRAKGHRMIRATIAKRIVEMKDEGKMKFRDIAETLQDENQDNDLYDILNEDYVKILYHRWKKVTSLKK